ncbi:MAG: DUF1015 domain-containing protein [Bryobacteraceae bacterium]
MATVKPFQPYRYTPKAGDPANLVTQPYDKISPAMQAKYLAASPYNLVRIILGERLPPDDDSTNCYTRAAAYLEQWTREGILAQDPETAFYAYQQEFTVPDTHERASRQGFIGLGKVEDYEAKIVHRHEQTLSGPKKDRMQVLTNTRAHFGHIFMLYPDPQAIIDGILNEAAHGTPVLDVVDDYGVRNRLWAITDLATIAKMETVMADKKLLIADGHHRYETALGYSKEHPTDPAARFVMMTFVNMFSPGLRILATHRVLRNVVNFTEDELLKRAFDQWKVTTFPSTLELKAAMQHPDPENVRIGMVTASGDNLLSRPRKKDELDVPVLHQEVLTGLLNITEEAVRDEHFITYVRGMDAASAEVREKSAQVAFLLDPTPIDDMARIAFGGGVMPQKSTDFFPKLLSGITIYKL